MSKINVNEKLYNNLLSCSDIEIGPILFTGMFKMPRKNG